MSTDLIQRTKELERKYTKHRKNPNAPEKAPRHYAAEILALPKSEQTEALKRVPAHFFTWVASYVNDPHAEQRIVNSTAAAIIKIKDREVRQHALSRVPEMFRDRVKSVATELFNQQRTAR